MKSKNGSISVSMGVKAKAESTAGFAMSNGKSQRDAQGSVGKQNVSPGMDINSAEVVKAASTSLMAGMSAYRGKGK